MAQAATRARRTPKKEESVEPAIKILTVEEIDAVDDLPEKVVLIPEWGEGVGVRVKALTEQQRADVITRATVRGEVDARLADLYGIVESVVEPRFTDKQVEILMRKNAAAIDRIKSGMMELNGLNAEALAAIEAAFRGLAE